MSDTRKQLERAFKLIKRDKNEEALAILRPIVVEEPHNVHAWWLLAYAETEPREVREALVTVLRLDPNYTNAPKAREMLEKLNQEYPPTADELQRFPELQSSFPDPFRDVFTDTDFPAEEPFAPDESPFAEEDLFTPTDFPAPGESLFSRDPFEELATNPFAEETKTPPKPRIEKDIRTVPTPVPMALDVESELDAEALAAREERAGRRRGRGRRAVFYLFTLLIVILGGAVVYYALSRAAETTPAADLGALEIVTLDAAPITSAVEGASAQLTSRLPGENEVILAKSEFGNTLYIRICGQADPALPDLIAAGMQVAAEQAEMLRGQLEAVGISVETCDRENPDTLYRATVSVEDAALYAGGEVSWTEFQKTWKKA